MIQNSNLVSYDLKCLFDNVIRRGITYIRLYSRFDRYMEGMNVHLKYIEIVIFCLSNFISALIVLISFYYIIFYFHFFIICLHLQFIFFCFYLFYMH